MSLWGACKAFDPGEIARAGQMAGRLLVVDLDLADRAVVEAARSALAPHRLAGTPCLFLLREMSARSQAQANALGARAVLPLDAPGATLLDTAGELLGQLEASGEAGQLQRRFIAASVAMADLLESAAGGPVPADAVNDSVEAINRAVDGGEIKAWLDLVWNHDDATYQHSLLVSGLAAAFAQRLGFGEADRRLITSAAVLHDIGKAKIPLAVLRKPGSLTAAEREVMRRHPQIGHEMLVAQGGFAPVLLAVVLSHHEWLDGSGYPEGLRGEQISDPVRMITICDIYAALIERRSYKPQMSPEKAYATLLTMEGKLDLDLVRVFGEVVLGFGTLGAGRPAVSALRGAG